MFYQLSYFVNIFVLGAGQKPFNIKLQYLTRGQSHPSLRYILRSSSIGITLIDSYIIFIFIHGCLGRTRGGACFCVWLKIKVLHIIYVSFMQWKHCRWFCTLYLYSVNIYMQSVNWQCATSLHRRSQVQIPLQAIVFVQPKICQDKCQTRLSLS